MVTAPKRQRIETRVCRRDRDGVELPWSPQLEKRKDFTTYDVLPDGSKRKWGGTGAPDVVPAPALDFTAVNATHAEFYKDYDEIQLWALLKDAHGTTPPVDATRAQLIGFLSMFPLPVPTPPPSGQATDPAPAPEVSAAAAPENVVTLPDEMDKLTKPQLVELAMVKFGYTMPDMNKDQMIATIKSLKPAAQG